jgi:hypothetical protein
VVVVAMTVVVMGAFVDEACAVEVTTTVLEA